jgi:hypothetical protein
MNETQHPPAIKFLVVSAVRGDRRYRALHLIEQLRLLGLKCELVHMSLPAIWEKLARPWDVVVFQRVAHGRHVERMLEQLGRSGALILSDFDDLIFNVRLSASLTARIVSIPFARRCTWKTCATSGACWSGAKGRWLQSTFWPGASVSWAKHGRLLC